MKRRIDKLDTPDEIRTPYILANPGICVGCWKCVYACPKRIIDRTGLLRHKHIVFKNAETCIGCKLCIRACPRGVFSEV